MWLSGFYSTTMCAMLLDVRNSPELTMKNRVSFLGAGMVH